jgi:small nuclear ribonucleoprotein E
LFSFEYAITFQKKTRVRIWIYEDVHVQMEGVIIGFDEYMNIVLDDAIEINTNSKQQQQKRINVGRCLLKGDAITLIQLRIYI